MRAAGFRLRQITDTFSTIFVAQAAIAGSSWFRLCRIVLYTGSNEHVFDDLFGVARAARVLDCGGRAQRRHRFRNGPRAGVGVPYPPAIHSKSGVSLPLPTAVQ